MTSASPLIIFSSKIKSNQSISWFFLCINHNHFKEEHIHDKHVSTIVKILTGEFAIQTCFQGRFGEELGSDQFGGAIMVHQVDKDTQVNTHHIVYFPKVM